MAKGPKVSHPEYVDFNSDEDDLLGDDDLLVDNSSDENYGELAINHANQDKTNDDDKKVIERLTKELNTLKLAHCYLLSTTLVSLEEEGMMQQSSVIISLSF